MAFVVRWAVLPALLVCVMVTTPTQAEDAAAKPSAEKPAATAPQKPLVRVTISKETTYITEPLRPDGYPDYVAALNRRASQGVTPENNAAVLFWKAMGPGTIDEKDRKKYFEMLGMQPLPEKGDYFIDYDAFLMKKQGERLSSVVPPTDGCDPLQDQYTTAQERLWSKEEFPEVYEWLAANEKPLALLIEASKRPRWYHPMICSGKEMVAGILLPAVQHHRVMIRALAARAMLRVHEGKIDEAWKDLLTCHRFARLVGQGQTVVDILVAIVIEGIACTKDQVLLHRTELTATKIAKMREDLENLPPMPKMADAMNVGERFTYLDSVALVARDGLSELKRLANLDGNITKDMIDSMTNSVGTAIVDWNIVLHTGNSWYDRMVDALRKPTRTDRTKSMKKFDFDFKRSITVTKDWKYLALSMLGNPSKAISERVGQTFLSLLLPATKACMEAEDRAAMSFELDKLAFALAAYRVDHGSYPAKLEELKPKYVAEVPKDFFANDGPLHYEVKDGGYLLYSVGVNGRDDGGKGMDDRNEDSPEDWDDLVVRMSAVK